MNDYQTLRLPNGHELKFHKGIFSYEQYEANQDIKARIYVDRKKDPVFGDYSNVVEIANDITHQERLNTYISGFRQYKLEGSGRIAFKGEYDKITGRRAVEYMIYAYRYVEGIDLVMDTISVCKLQPDDEYEMKLLYLLAKYLKDKAGFIDAHNRVQLPPISPIRK